MDPERIDLERLARDLARAVGAQPMEGFRRGKTSFKGAVMEQIDCSELEAEELVDTLVSRGFLRYHGESTTIASGYWVISVDRGEAHERS